MNKHIGRIGFALECDPPSHQEIIDFIQGLPALGNVRQMCKKGSEFLARLPSNMVLEVTSEMSHAHPFFLPRVDEATAASLKIGMRQFVELVMRCRLTANHAKKTNILVACAPKSASTFIAAALGRALDLHNACLTCPTVDGQLSSLLGANLRSQELDELALLRNGLDPRSYVAQHHVRCTPYLANQLALYQIKPIVTIRNFFDSLVSLDDMFVADRRTYEHAQIRFFNDGLPAHYSDMALDDRLELLVDVHAVWYVQFLMSWQKCETFGAVKPLWVSYEHDFLGNKQLLAEKIADFIGFDGVSLERLADALDDKRDGAKYRLNKGVAGRGENVPEGIRRRALAIFKRYDQDGDLSPLIGI
ncbi:MAG TPA: hypothetical protein DDW73_07865 [Rhizobium sp.]|jgi:hypothetical protein|nr:hypothetical protein [Rhizobium sp.]